MKAENISFISKIMTSDQPVAEHTRRPPCKLNKGRLCWNAWNFKKHKTGRISGAANLPTCSSMPTSLTVQTVPRRPRDCHGIGGPSSLNFFSFQNEAQVVWTNTKYPSAMLCAPLQNGEHPRNQRRLGKIGNEALKPAQTPLRQMAQPFPTGGQQ